MIFLRSISLIALLLASASSHDDGSGTSHSHASYSDEVDPLTIKLHRVANDPLLEDLKQLKTILDR
jgi:hypothetical protein